MTANVVRFPDVVCVKTPHGDTVRAKTPAGRNLLSDVFGLPCTRQTEIENLALDIVLRRSGLVAYDMPMREGR